MSIFQLHSAVLADYGDFVRDGDLLAAPGEALKGQRPRALRRGSAALRCLQRCSTTPSSGAANTADGEMTVSPSGTRSP